VNWTCGVSPGRVRVPPLINVKPPGRSSQGVCFVCPAFQTGPSFPSGSARTAAGFREVLPEGPALSRGQLGDRRAHQVVPAIGFVVVCVIRVRQAKSGPARVAGQCAAPTQVLVIGAALGKMRIFYPTGKCRAFRAIFSRNAYFSGLFFRAGGCAGGPVRCARGHPGREPVRRGVLCPRQSPAAQQTSYAPHPAETDDCCDNAT